jgi:S1-C subfamily serine protease
MKLDRRVPLPWLALIAVVACAWCSAMSGVAGLITGRDMARREASVQMATAISAGLDLPPLGVLVTRLDRGGPADRGGVERGDLIVRLNGAQVQDVNDLRDRLLALAAGQRARLTLLRGQDERSLDVVLGAFPGDPQRPYLGVYFTARAEDPADL